MYRVFSLIIFYLLPRIAQIPEVFVSPNLELNPFRSLPYIAVQLPSVLTATATAVADAAAVVNKNKLPSLFHTFARGLSLSQPTVTATTTTLPSAITTVSGVGVGVGTGTGVCVF